VRGVGILEREYCSSAPLRLIVALGDEGERMPAPWPYIEMQGFHAPALSIHAFTQSAPLKIEIALQKVVKDQLWPKLIFQTANLQNN
jgi:hypothetical protein